jgi:preprotein translocase subunit SecE
MKKFYQKLADFFKEVQGELKKISYPSKSETIGSTTVVIIFVIIVGFFLASVDSVLMRIIRLVIH